MQKRKPKPEQDITKDRRLQVFVSAQTLKRVKLLAVTRGITTREVVEDLIQSAPMGDVA